MRAHLLLVVALAICACKKDKPAEPAPAAAPASTTELDALWALAPDRAFAGVVISPTGVARLEAGALELNKFYAAAPELAPFKAKVDEELQEIFGTSSPSLAAAGLTAKKGLAVFAAEGADKPIVILPVADRDKFLAVVKGQKGTDSDTIKRATCKQIKDVYACARSPELFERLGKGNLTDLRKLVNTRGDIEFAAAIPSSQIAFAGVVQLTRGGAVVRASVKGLPADAKQLLANAKPRTKGDKTAGFAVLSLAGVLPLLKDKVPPAEILPGVALDKLVRSIEGPLTMTVDNGAAMFDVQLPLNDGAVAKQLVEQCDKLEPAQMLGATVKDGACHAAIPQMQLELDAWVDGKTLHVGKQGAQSASTSAPMTPVAQELANGEWVMAMFGRGTMFGQAAFAVPLPPGQLPPEAMAAMRGFTMLDELGFGARVDGELVRVVAVVRTAWSNPDEVVAKLVAIPLQDVLQGKAGAQGKAIADAHPQSLFAADYKTGVSGLMMPASMIGVLAAVAIPAFVDYMKKGKRSEAQLQLNKLGKNLKTAYIMNAEFPKGTVGPTPAKSCCDAGGKCNPDSKTWADPVWQSLDFQIDEPHLFRYAYTSDGKTFTAKAIGDLDCDGKEIEYVMTGSAEGGNPSVDVIAPQPNSD